MTKEAAVNTALGYVRVSREEQAANGSISLDMQRAEISAYCERKGWRLVTVLADERSGKDLNRNGVRQVIEAAKEGKAQAVVMYRLDRLTRSLQDLCQILTLFRKAGVALVSATEGFDVSTPEGEAMANMLGTFAQYERRIISARQRSRIRYRQSRGEWQGALPYGWTAAPGDHAHPERWRKVPAEHKVLRQIRAMRGAGRTLQQIADRLNADGVPTRRGKSWSHVTVRYLLHQGRSARPRAQAH